MAFGFFRRRQKMVIIIMASLMVAFLVGAKGLNMIFGGGGSGGDQVIGTTISGTITTGKVRSAHSNLNLLESIGLIEDVNMFRRINGDQSPLAYALLIEEARSMEITVTVEEVKAFLLGRLGLDEPAYGGLVSRMRSVMTESQLLGIVARWLMVAKAGNIVGVNSLPSDTELSEVYRDVTEQIAVRIMKMPGEDFLKDVPEPNEDEILRQFEDYRGVLPGFYANEESFGFGYRVPDRVNVQYLFIDRAPIERVTRPTDDQALNSYMRNKSSYVKQTLVEPAPIGDGNDTDPNDPNAVRPVEYKAEQMSFAEAKSQIIQELSIEETDARIRDIAGRVEREIDGFGPADKSREDIYKQIRGSLIQSADELLARKLANVRIDGQPLTEAIATLTESADLAAICYPWGTRGERTVAPDVRVTVKADQITLAEALAQVTEQAMGPKLKWAMCRGFTGVLFSVGAGDTEGVDFFPVSTGETGMVDFSQFANHELLGTSSSRPGSRDFRDFLVQVAFGAEEFNRGRPAVVRIGKEGPRMYVRGGRQGQLFWRLTGAEPSHEPQEISDQLREKIVENLKTVAAFELAKKKCQELGMVAVRIGVESVAKKNNRQVETTGMFTRKTVDWSGNLAYNDVPALEVPVDYIPADPDAVSGNEFRKAMMQTIFSLSPGSIEPPYPDDPPAVTILAIPLRREVVLVERADFLPVVRQEYAEFGRGGAARIVGRMQRLANQLVFRKLESVSQRMGFLAGQR